MRGAYRGITAWMLRRPLLVTSTAVRKSALWISGAMVTSALATTVLWTGEEEKKEFVVDAGLESSLEEGGVRVVEDKARKIKILLSKRGGVVSAVGASCTHMGCGIASTVCQGVATCACHGAQFDISSGEVLNAPALDALPKYRVRVEGRNIFVHVPVEQLSRTPKFGRKCKCKGERQVVIIGSGAAGLVCAQSLRQEGFKGRIVMVTKDEELPYDRTGLSKKLDVPDDLTLRSEAFYGVNDIELWRGRDVTAVDPTLKRISFLDGGDLLYDSLVIASGGVARMRSIPGAGGELSNVFTLRTIDDAKKIRDAVRPDSRVVIVGSSFIGMEAAASLIDRLKVRDVTVIGIENCAFEKIFGTRVGRALQSWYESKGVKFENASTVERVDGTIGSATSVVLRGGKALGADVVILGLGIVPASNFVRHPPFKKDRGGFLVVNEYLEAAPDVWAVGDVCSFPYLGKHINVQHWAVAQQQGRVAAYNIVHPNERRSYTTPPFFWSNSFGKSIRFVGSVAEGWDSLVVDGEPEALSFRAFYVKDDAVTALVCMGRDPEAAAAMELFARNKMPSLLELQHNPKLLLSDLVQELHRKSTEGKY